MKITFTLVLCYIYFTGNAQQVNGTFTPFAKNNIWGNVVINTATYENSGYITLGGYYEGALKSVTVNNVRVSKPNKIPLLMQLYQWGEFRGNFGVGGGYVILPSPTTDLGSCTIDKTYISNGSPNPASIQYIIAGHNEEGEGYLMKNFISGAKPTAYNAGNIRFFNLGPSYNKQSYIEDFVFGQYTVRKGVLNYVNDRIILSAYSSSTGAPISTFGDNGDIILPVPNQQRFNDSLPVKIIMGGDLKLYVAFSVKTTSQADEILLYRVNPGPIGKIDSSFGTSGVATWPVPNPYAITSINFHTNESITIGGYNTDTNGVPSFLTFNHQGYIQSTTSYNFSVGQPFPGYGCKNISAKLATVNGEERIVFAYAKPTGIAGKYQIAIGSHKPGEGTDPLIFTPWSSDDFISVEPTELTVASNTGFVVAGNATRADGSIAGVVIKYNVDGSLDQNFGTMGALKINGRLGGNPWIDLAQLPDNKYLAVGSSFPAEDHGKSSLLFQKFLATGEPDESFGTNGTVHAYTGMYGRSAKNVHVLPNGKFLIGGTYESYLNEPGIGGASSTRATVYKMMPDGTPDVSFGPAANGRFHIYGLTYMETKLQDDTIYMAGNAFNTHAGGGKALIYKLSPDGIIYSSYAPRLPVLQCFTISENTGNAFVAGGLNGTPKSICKVKRGAEGKTGFADSSFGTNGIVSQTLINSGELTEIKEIKIRPGYLFVVSTWKQSNSGSAPSGIYFNSISSDAGVMNMNFGTNGNKFLQIPGATSVQADHFKWMDEGFALLIFGRAVVGGVTKGFICKVNSSGELLTEYGDNGVIWTNETNFDYRVMIKNNEDDLVVIDDLGFFNGGALSKLKLPASVFNIIQPGVWLGAINNDWFNSGNWQAGMVPDDLTDVIIAAGNVIIGGNRTAKAFKVTLQAGATLTVEQGSNLVISSDDDE